MAGRSPHGERGLKSALSPEWITEDKSLPSRGAWIEIHQPVAPCLSDPGRSPHGERGLKLVTCSPAAGVASCRSPHGERGLK